MGIPILICGLRIKAHSEPCQTSKIECFAKIVYRFFFAKGSTLDENRYLFSQDAPSLMVDTVLDTPLAYGNIHSERSAYFLELPGQ